MKFSKSTKKAYITLTLVLLVSLISLASLSVLVLLSVDQAKNSVLLERLSKAKYLANTCSERALGEIKNDPDFASSTPMAASFALSGGSCNYLVFGLGGENREIRATGQVNNLIRREKIIIDKTSPLINLVSWQIVADF